MTVKDLAWPLEVGADGQMVNSSLVQKALEELVLRWDRIVDDNPIGYVHRVKLNRYIDWWRRNPWRSNRPADDQHDTEKAAS